MRKRTRKSKKRKLSKRFLKKERKRMDTFSSKKCRKSKNEVKEEEENFRVIINQDTVREVYNTIKENYGYSLKSLAPVLGHDLRNALYRGNSLPISVFEKLEQLYGRSIPHTLVKRNDIGNKRNFLNSSELFELKIQLKTNIKEILDILNLKIEDNDCRINLIKKTIKITDHDGFIYFRESNYL